MLDVVFSFFCGLWPPLAVQDSEDNHSFFFNEVYYSIRKPLDEMASCSLVISGMSFRIALDEPNSCVNLQYKIVSEPFSFLLIPCKHSQKISFCFGPYNHA